MPIRTGLDERMKSIQQDLREYFEEAKDVYSTPVTPLRNLTASLFRGQKSASKGCVK